MSKLLIIKLPETNEHEDVEYVVEEVLALIDLGFKAGLSPFWELKEVSNNELFGHRKDGE